MKLNNLLGIETIELKYLELEKKYVNNEQLRIWCDNSDIKCVTDVSLYLT